ncbi:MarR family winged helix-turn-helix transcriptional regulator [Mycobacteroides chelonae]|uniref:MarR family winged helix-turn-helix transcriptional regulator n=1 Tax=Mycobacteroides chelonae TaxID=1774 RepID=UPI0018E3781C|nr:MarR family transcriptional regulator [Mycobacteroides chelonae]
MSEGLRRLRLLVESETRLWRAVELRLAHAGLPKLGSVEVLSFINSRNQTRVNDIAEGLVVTTGGATKIVDRLEESQLVCRLPNPDDRRSSLLELTDEGLKVLGEAAEVVDVAIGSFWPSVRGFDPALTDLRDALSADFQRVRPRASR